MSLTYATTRPHASLVNLFQDRFQDIWEILDQYIAMRKMYDKLGLSFGQCTDDTKAMLKEQGIGNLTTAQLKKTLDKITEEHHAIILLYKADKTRYRKYVKQLENTILEEGTFPKDGSRRMSDTCSMAKCIC